VIANGYKKAVQEPIQFEKKLNRMGAQLNSASGVAADVGRAINFGEIRGW
jgi:hypothetical protein